MASLSIAFSSPAVLPARRKVLPRVCPRASLASSKTRTEDEASRYVGTPPQERRGRLRVGVERFTEPPAPPALDAERYGWSSGSYNRLTRSVAVWSFIAVLLSRNYLDGKRFSYFMFKKTDEKLRARRRELAAWARGRILELGPTMIKVGQLAAARADILPPEVIEELLELTDKVPAFSWPAVEAILVREYGKPVSEVFKWFDKTPLAAASLGQVHRACLPDGTLVVVKVQRPTLRELFDLDLNALRGVAEYLQRSKRYGGKTRDWIGIYEECRQTLYDEIDYRLELENADEFRNNFADTPWAFVPKYAPGIGVRDTEGMKAAGIDPVVIANRVAQLLLRQILDYATFQSDPHVGNISVTNSAGGSIILYDFGMVGRLNPRIKEQLIDVLLGVIEKDADLVMHTLVDLGALVLPADPLPVRRAIQFFLDSIGSRPTRDQTVAAIGDDLYATAQDKPFRLPAASVFLLRAFSTTEGVCKTLDPNFSFAKISQPYADELLRGRRADAFDGGSSGPLVLARSLADAALTGKPDLMTQQLQKQLVGTGTNLVQAASRIEKTEKTLTKLENGDIKVRSRSVQTERLLQRQYELSRASNYLVVAAASAVVAVQVWLMGQNPETTGLIAAFSAISGLAFVRKSAQIDKDPFSSDK